MPAALSWLPGRTPRARTASALALSLLLPALLAAAATPALARRRRAKRPQQEVAYRALLLIEADTGRILKAVNPRRRVIPASIVKMMTVLLTLERIRAKAIRLDDMVTVSARASRIGGQQVYLAEGERFRLRDLLRAIMISSANDAAYAVAEHVAGDAGVFVEMMNERARQLGMTDTRFVNVNGLPPGRGKPANLMSARDAGILARQLLRKHPFVTKWTRTKRATFRGGTFTLTNTNRLLGRFRGMDGLKTGYYRKAGFSIVATAKRANMRLIAVVFGSSRSRRRFEEAKKLLAWGFSRYRWVEVGREIPPGADHVRVLSGRKRRVALEAQGRVRALVRLGDERRIATKTEIPESIRAPIRAGQRVGRLVYELGGNKIGEVPLVAGEAVERLGFFQTLIRLR